MFGTTSRTAAHTSRRLARLLTTGVAAAGLVSVFAMPADAGFGGVQASAWSGYKYLGSTQVYGVSYIDWYTPTTGTCTHAYPNNDMYYNNLNGFNTYSFSGSTTTSNCNRVVLYLNGTQGGGGAVNCYRSNGTCHFPNSTFYSISWHNS